MKDISRIGFGCVALTKQPFLSKAMHLLNKVYDNGITNFDTAPVYGIGYSEIILGKFIRDKRNKVFVTTKFGLGNIPVPNLGTTVALPLNYIKKKIEKKYISPEVYQKTPSRTITKHHVEHDFFSSLKRINTSYIDTYLLHEALPSFLTDEARTFIEDLKKNGDILKLGVGICYKNLLDINAEELTNWDILQYENNESADSREIYEKFPYKTHIHHSLFRNSTGNNSNILNNHLSQFPKVKILFSSSNEKHIKANLGSLKF